MSKMGTFLGFFVVAGVVAVVLNAAKTQPVRSVGGSRAPEEAKVEVGGERRPTIDPISGQATGRPTPGLVVADDAPVFKVPLGGTLVVGPDDARVTLVEFSELGCAFCPRAHAMLEKLRRDHGDKVRFAWKTTGRAEGSKALAEEVLLAIEDEERFLPLYAGLERAAVIDEATVYSVAAAGGLSKLQVDAMLATGLGRTRVAQDRDLAALLKVEDTPTFFVNGLRVTGRDLSVLEATVLREIERVEAWGAAGVDAQDLYPALLARGQAGAQPVFRPRAKPEGEVRQGVRLDPTAPRKGSTDAVVGLVLWAQMPCSACARTIESFDRVLALFPKDIVLEYRHLPLEGEAGSRLAAEAAVAAHAQGGFWRFLGILQDSGVAVVEASLTGYAKRAGLDLVRFNKDRSRAGVDAVVEGDRAEASRLGVRGVPTLFVNGIPLRGEVSFEKLRAVVTREMAQAKEMIVRGVPRAEVYGALLAQGEGEGVEAIAEVEPTSILTTATAPRVGRKGAPVEVVVFSDFECPACRTAAKKLAEVQAASPEKVALVFKHYPLPSHVGAESAAIAAHAAHKQGKFWAYHDHLFQHRGPLTKGAILQLARVSGLNVDQFKRDIVNPEVIAIVKADIAEGVKLGVTGTPTVFLNGQRLEGAQVLETLPTRVEELLARG